MEQLLTTLRTSSPQLLGLPARLTRLEEQRADAVLQCQHVIDLWIAADAGARESANSRQRDGFRRHANELLGGVDREQNRCREVGAKVPPLPGGLMTAILGFIEKQTADLARRLVDQEEVEFVAQSVPGTPGREAALTNIRERK
jgi:hypothetical protein